MQKLSLYREFRAEPLAIFLRSKEQHCPSPNDSSTLQPLYDGMLAASVI